MGKAQRTRLGRALAMRWVLCAPPLGKTEKDGESGGETVTPPSSLVLSSLTHTLNTRMDTGPAPDAPVAAKKARIEEGEKERGNRVLEFYSGIGGMVRFFATAPGPFVPHFPPNQPALRV